MRGMNRGMAAAVRLRSERLLEEPLDAAVATAGALVVGRVAVGAVVADSGGARRWPIGALARRAHGLPVDVRVAPVWTALCGRRGGLGRLRGRRAGGRWVGWWR